MKHQDEVKRYDLIRQAIRSRLRGFHDVEELRKVLLDALEGTNIPIEISEVLLPNNNPDNIRFDLIENLEQALEKSQTEPFTHLSYDLIRKILAASFGS